MQINPEAAPAAASLLASQLVKERASRRQERFYVIFAIVLVADAALAIVSPSISASLVILLTLIFLIGLASLLEVPAAAQLLGKLLSLVQKKVVGGGDGTEESDNP